METSQIIRLPKKYWELFDTMEDEQVWKLIKCLINWKWDLTGLTKTYYNIIKVDLDNLEKSAMNWSKWAIYWKLWWRPKKTPQGLNEKPLKEDKISKYKIKEDNIQIFLNKILDLQLRNRVKKEIDLQIQKWVFVDNKRLENIKNKIMEEYWL